MTANSLNNRTSRYVQGGQTEVGRNGLEWWDRYSFPIDNTDLEYTVSVADEGRLDLIAHSLYGDYRLWWFIAQYNSILDPVLEIFPGRILRLPTTDRMQLLMTQHKGGIASTRQTSKVLPPVIL